MTVSWIVTIAGIAVCMFGWFLTPSTWGYGVFGFGLAHIVFGIIDMFRYVSEMSRRTNKEQEKAPDSSG